MARTVTNRKKKRSKISRKITRSSVAKIAKNVMMKVTETKSAMNSFDFGLQMGMTHCFNLLYFMNQGDSAVKVIGEQIFLKSVNIKGFFYSHFNYKSFPSYVKVVIIKTKDKLSAGSLSAITASDVFRSEAYPSHPLRDHVDLHKVDLLYDRTFKLPADNTGAATLYNSKRFNKSLKINKKLTWDAEGLSGLSGYLKDKNIYIVFQAFTPGATALDTLIEGGMSYSVNFKDP